MREVKMKLNQKFNNRAAWGKFSTAMGATGIVAGSSALGMGAYGLLTGTYFPLQLAGVGGFSIYIGLMLVNTGAQIKQDIQNDRAHKGPQDQNKPPQGPTGF